MKTFNLLAGWVLAIAGLFSLAPGKACGQSAAVAVGLFAPTNGEVFGAPANIYVHARVADSNVVRTVQYFSGGTSIGLVTNSTGVLVTNLSQSNPFFITWSNVLAGAYSLTAVVSDRAGNVATSAAVSITVTNPIVRPAVYTYSPANGATFHSPASLAIYARSVETAGTVATVQFFANSTSLGVVSNSSQMVFTNISTEPLFPLAWSNVLAGSYALKVVATDLYGNTATSSVVRITVVTNAPPPPVPFAISFWYPTNGQTFAAPATVGVHALVTDSNVVRSVQYFANGGSLGTVSNASGVLLTNLAQDSPFYLGWSNVLAGGYVLTAVAADAAGSRATSAPVNITVTNPPPPVTRPMVDIYSPSNGTTYRTPVSVNIFARAYEAAGTVATVQFFANSTSLGVVSNTDQMVFTNISTAPLFFVAWSNAPAGAYGLKAVATDLNGSTATSSVVSITVVTNNPPPPPPPIPFAVSFWYPTNGQLFTAPASVGVHARVTDSNVVEEVRYFANGGGIGTATNSSGVALTNSTANNPFFLLWSNVPAGTYGVTAVARDSAGNTATSGPVTIYVVTNLPPVISIYAPDPVAVEGTNFPNFYNPTSMATNYVSGTNTATFLIHRDSATNTDLTVDYSIGGTAINGEDYETIPGSVTIPAGKSYALITIIPMDDGDSSYRYYDTVVLSLIAPSQAASSPPPWLVGTPWQAGAIILEENYLPMPRAVIRALDDNSLHVSLPATNGMNFCLQISTDLVNWLPVCTNTVLKGSAHFVDPNGASGTGLYYRIVPVAVPATY